jgi:hypothetical protein
MSTQMSIQNSSYGRGRNNYGNDGSQNNRYNYSSETSNGFNNTSFGNGLNQSSFYNYSGQSNPEVNNTSFGNGLNQSSFYNYSGQSNPEVNSNSFGNFGSQSDGYTVNNFFGMGSSPSIGSSPSMGGSTVSDLTNNCVQPQTKMAEMEGQALGDISNPEGPQNPQGDILPLYQLLQSVSQNAQDPNAAAETSTLTSEINNLCAQTGLFNPLSAQQPPICQGRLSGNVSVWGDPHFIAADGTTGTDMIAAGNNSLLLQSSDGANIVAQTGTYGSNGATVFTQSAVNLNDGVSVSFNASNGTADEVNTATGAVITQLQSGQTLDAGGDSVTYNGTSGSTAASLSYSLANTGGNAATGTIQSVVDQNAQGGGYLNISASATGGNYGGMLANLPSTYNGVNINQTTGQGTFTNNQTNANFQENSLFVAAQPIYNLTGSVQTTQTE